MEVKVSLNCTYQTMAKKKEFWKENFIVSSIKITVAETMMPTKKLQINIFCNVKAAPSCQQLEQLGKVSRADYKPSYQMTPRPKTKY